MLNVNSKKLIKISVRGIFVLSVFTVFAALFSLIGLDSAVYAKNCSCHEQADVSTDIDAPASDTLTLINKYQKKYFEIIKRNNMFLQLEENNKIKKDKEELNALFAEVENQVAENKYLKKYKQNQKRFAQCDAETTIDINEFADKNYKAVNKLLNKVYKKAEAKLSFDDAQKLAQSELKWEKEVEDYQKVYNSMEFGTIGTSIFYTYEINMREFRTLLLMLYL